jgi:hypothetical protein
MKRSTLALFCIALISLSIAGCTTLKPFTPDELAQISGFPASSQGR